MKKSIVILIFIFAITKVNADELNSVQIVENPKTGDTITALKGEEAYYITNWTLNRPTPRKRTFREVSRPQAINDYDRCVVLEDGKTYSGRFTVCKQVYEFQEGIAINGPSEIDGNGAEIKCVAPPGEAVGISLLSSDIRLENFVISHWPYGIHSDPEELGLVPGDSIRNINIVNNIFKHNDRGMILYMLSDSVIRNNLLQSDGINIMLAIDGEGYDNYIGNNLIEANEIAVNDLGGAIAIESFADASNDGNTVRNNIITYIGCEIIHIKCVGSAVLANNAANNLITENMISNFSGNTIQIGAVNNIVTKNVIDKLWTGAYYATGIAHVNNWKPTDDPARHLIRDNIVIEKEELAYPTRGFAALPQLWPGTANGGCVIEDNYFKTGIGYYGTKFWSTVQPNHLYRNSYISTQPIVNHLNPSHSLEAFENYYSIHSEECNPNSHGYCQNPFTWDFGIDKHPKARPYS